MAYRAQKLVGPGLVLAVGTLLIWQPAHALIATPLDYIRFYLGRQSSDLLHLQATTRRRVVDLTIAAACIGLAIVVHTLNHAASTTDLSGANAAARSRDQIPGATVRRRSRTSKHA